ncbi:MAG: hypothetical protein KC438_05045 [Thermomicrobiales bacterium]|nr:hypothetical protein [Thermomicrobiales bacterium]MCO5222212.1 amidase family protein [Thermomicrobiales bacterium]
MSRIRLLLVSLLVLAAIGPVAQSHPLAHAQEDEWQEEDPYSSEEETYDEDPYYYEDAPTYDDALEVHEETEPEITETPDLSWLPDTTYRPVDFSPFEQALAEISPERMRELQGMIVEANIPQLQQLMDDHKLTSQELVLFYIDRIRTYDVGQLNAVTQINPDALYLAHLRDIQRTNGEIKGPLQGIPVLLKENIATGDTMVTTAGAAALADATAADDAYLVQQLRDAGAVILGKVNMTEWANWMHLSVANGFSSFGGQTHSPFGGDPSGSSTGSAVAVTANFVPLAIGTETIGSIISPSTYASVVGMHPTTGLISSDNIIPLSPDFDTAGPIGKSVEDVAVAMTVFAGTLDIADTRSSRATPVAGMDFMAALDPNALHGVRLGLIPIDDAYTDEDVIASFNSTGAVDALIAAGADVVVVRPTGMPEPDWWQIIACEMRDGINAYLQENQIEPSTLAEIIALNESDPAVYMPLGQDRLIEADGCQLSAEEAETLARDAETTAQTYIDDLLESNDLDALVALDDSWSLEYGMAGYPAITVQRGIVGDWLTNLTFIGPSCSDVVLVGYAYAFQQTGPYRQVPTLTAQDSSASPIPE